MFADFNHFSPVNKSVVMATTLITVHCKLFQIMPYVVILEVRKFHQPTTVLSKQGNNHLNRLSLRRVSNKKILLQDGCILGVSSPLHCVNPLSVATSKNYN